MSTTEMGMAPGHRQHNLRKTLGRIAVYVAVIVVATITFFPIYWMIVCTLQPNEYTLHFPPSLFPQAITFDQFVQIFASHPLGVWLRNSFVIALLTMLICMIFSVMGAYTLSNLRWKGRNLFGLFLLVTQMLPEMLVLIPIYSIYRNLALLNNLNSLAVIDAAFILPICVWILKGVFDTVPSEILDAALVDGCTELSVIWRIVLGKAELMPASVGLSTLKEIGRTPIEQYMAAGLIFSILPILFYLIMQRYIVSGLTAGAVKG